MCQPMTGRLYDPVTRWTTLSARFKKDLGDQRDSLCDQREGLGDEREDLCDERGDLCEEREDLGDRRKELGDLFIIRLYK